MKNVSSVENIRVIIRARNEALKKNDEAGSKRVETILNLANMDGCKEKKLQYVRQLVDDFSGIFNLEGEWLPTTNLIKYKIELNCDKIIKNKMFRYIKKLIEPLQKKLTKLTEEDIGEPADRRKASTTKETGIRELQQTSDYSMT